MTILEALNCPECGAPLEIERIDTTGICLQCGSRIRVTDGSRGQKNVSINDRMSDLVTENSILMAQTKIRGAIENDRKISILKSGEYDATLRRNQQNEMRALMSKTKPPPDVSKGCAFNGLLVVGFIGLVLAMNRGSYAALLLCLPVILYVIIMFLVTRPKDRAYKLQKKSIEGEVAAKYGRMLDDNRAACPEGHGPINQRLSAINRQIETTELNIRALSKKTIAS